MKNPKDFASAATLSMLSSRASGALIGPREAMTAGTSNSQREPWVMAEGTLQALKWGALLLMVLDHANKYLYAERLPVIFQVGRLVMPIFGFVLAYNLARPDALARGLHRRMMFRLALAGLAACPIVIILNGPLVSANPWWPLNILFTLWLVVAITFLIDRGGVGRCAPLDGAAVLLGRLGFLPGCERKIRTPVVLGDAVVDRRQWQRLGTARHPADSAHLAPVT